MKSRTSQLTFNREYIKCDQRGRFSIGISLNLTTIIDFCNEEKGIFKFKEGEKRKVIFIVPGVTGCSDEPYVKEICGFGL